MRFSRAILLSQQIEKFNFAPCTFGNSPCCAEHIPECMALSMAQCLNNCTQSTANLIKIELVLFAINCLSISSALLWQSYSLSVAWRKSSPFYIRNETIYFYTSNHQFFRNWFHFVNAHGESEIQIIRCILKRSQQMHGANAIADSSCWWKFMGNLAWCVKSFVFSFFFACRVNAFPAFLIRENENPISSARKWQTIGNWQWEGRKWCVRQCVCTRTDTCSVWKFQFQIFIREYHSNVLKKSVANERKFVVRLQTISRKLQLIWRENLWLSSNLPRTTFQTFNEISNFTIAIEYSSLKFSLDSMLTVFVWLYWHTQKRNLHLIKRTHGECERKYTHSSKQTNRIACKLCMVV